MINISVIIIIKDGEKYIRYLNKYFNKIENIYKLYYNFEYYIYENNSKDNTKEEIKKFFINRKGKYWCENIDKNKNFKSDVLNDRGIYMKSIRNKLKHYHGQLNSDFTLFLDSDVIISDDIIPKLLNSFNRGLVYIGSSNYSMKIINIDVKLIDNLDGIKILNNNDMVHCYILENNKCIINRIDKDNGWFNDLYLKANFKDVVMVTPFDICYRFYKKNNDKNHYYDSLAFENKNGVNYNNTNNSCLFKNCKKCLDKRKNTLKKEIINDLNIHLLDYDETVRVNSAFGGCCMIKTEIYNKVFWEGEYSCEHIGFCKEVRKYGNIILNSKIKVCTTINRFRNYNEIQEELFI